MAWNGSNGRGERPQSKPRQPKRRPQGLLVAVCGLVVLAGVCVVAWVMSGGEKPPQKTDEPRKEKKTTPVVVSDAKPAKPVAQEESPGVRTNRWGEVVKRKKPETYVDERGILRYKKGNGRVPNPDDFKNPTRISTRGNMHEFKHPVENEIATLIMAQPGEMLVGEPDYSNMKQDFVNALIDKIEIDEDDSEMDRELKQNVEELKKELAERVKNGEDLVEILKEARRELRMSADYKQNLNDVILEQLYDPSISDDELATAMQAANKMLEAKGIEPIAETRFLKVRKRMLRAQERRNAEAAGLPAAN